MFFDREALPTRRSLERYGTHELLNTQYSYICHVMLVSETDWRVVQAKQQEKSVVDVFKWLCYLFDWSFFGLPWFNPGLVLF